VNDIPAVVNDPQYNSRKNIFEIDYPGIGKLKIPGPVPHLSVTPAALVTPAPRVGEHNGYVYRGYLGYDDEKIGELEKEGVIVSKPPY
jgi:crotonobetainyl-CoA:carnitine CoA-transferase CaiB-like acyl-CoA transferase